MQTMDNTNTHEGLDQQSRDSASWVNTGREELLMQRRRCFILISVLPFLISAIALSAVLAGAPQTLDASPVALRGNSNGRDAKPQSQESYLSDFGTLPSETFTATNTSATSSVSPATTGFINAPTEQPSITVETTKDTTQTEASPATPATTTETTTITTQATTTTMSVETADILYSHVESVDILYSHPSATAAAEASAESMTATPTTTSLGSCEEAATHEQCTTHSSKCVWFSPLNWSELCFTKPSFPLNNCKEVRLVDSCLQSAVGCKWTIETKPGPDKDVCRFSRHTDTSVRGGKHWTKKY